MSKTSKNIPSATIAVVPFENLTVGEGLDIFCKSFSIELVTELSRFRQFQIIHYPSQKEWEKTSENLNGSTHLPPDYTIQGSFRNNKKVIVINAQLIHGPSQQVVWAERFERNLSQLFFIHEDILREVVASLQQPLNQNLLVQIRNKPHTKLKAYENWLYGWNELKTGTPESNKKARKYFKKAMSSDPSYSLACSGMSLTYFNEWSCQLWSRWDVSKNGAREWADKAIQMDDQNYIAAYVLGRVLLYEGAYESAEFYMRKSLELNANDPDSLIIIALCFMYLGLSHEALVLFEKAVKLNPVRAEYYYPIGVFILFELKEYGKAIQLLKKTRNIPWFDAHAFFAAIWYDLHEQHKMKRHWKIFFESYKKIINKGKECTPQEAVEWMMKINPYRYKTNLEPFWKYITAGKITIPRRPVEEDRKATAPEHFLKDGKLWKMSYNSRIIYLPELKGFHDLRKMLAHPTNLFHCAELMGSVPDATGSPLMDEKAKKAYQERVRHLRDEIQQAESGSDFQRSSQLQEECEKLLEHLSQSLGLKRKIRKSGSAVEKARSAITWRIRNAISKIEKAHPALGKHLSNSVKTGTFCSYEPDQAITWITG